MNDLTTLSDAIRAGSEAAFEALFRAEFRNVAFFVNRYVRDDVQAEDITQESFLSLWKNRERIDPRQNLRNYVLTIARNRALNYLRDVISRKGGTLEGREAEIHARILQHPEVELRIEALETEEMLGRVFRSLPDKAREMFVMSRQEGLTYAEISQKLGVSVKVVEYNIVLALKAFRRAMPNVSGILLLLLSLFLGNR
jgi:RNA polymerase sigma-70 factor (ECF subfamily)